MQEYSSHRSPRNQMDPSLAATRAAPARRADRAQPPDGATRVSRPVKKERPNGGAGGRPPQKPPGGAVAKQVFINIGKALLVLLCIGVICGAIAMVFVATYLVEATANDDLVLDLDFISVPRTGYIMARNDAGEWVEYQKLVDEGDTIWAALYDIPQQLQDAVISTEDRDFENHGGVNWGRTIYAALNEVMGFQDTFGASTIDQQLVKNLTGEKEVTGEDGMLDGYKRKAREIYRALGLNNRYSKDMILEAYLNTMPLSGTIVGVQAGAKEYFGKDVSELTLAECAMIAGITQAPGKYNPYTNPEECLTRRNNVLGFMLENGKINQSEYNAAKDEPLTLYDGPRQADVSAGETGIQSYFSDTVLETVVSDLVEKGIVDSRQAAINLYYNGGLVIESTLNMEMQRAIEEVYEKGTGEGGLFPAELSAEVTVEDENGVATTRTVQPQSAMAVVDYDGALVGIVGGMGEKKESLGLNRATQSPRSIGSTMKPLTAYALGLDYGIITYGSRIQDAYVLNRETGTAGTPDWPVNYSGAPSGNSVPVADAVAESLNTVPVRIGTWIGVEDMFTFLRDTLGITTLVETGATNDLGYSSLVLGGMTHGITATELANAYTMFGGEESYGVVNTLHCYERVLDANGNILLEPDLISVQAVSPETGYIVNRLLSNVLRSSGPVAGTASGMALETSDSVAKTGTTSDDKDRWFVGLTPNYVAAVWWGYDDNIEMDWPAAASTNPPPNVWKAVMDTVQAGMPQKEFPARPETVSEAQFCRDTGLLAGSGCGNLQLGYFSIDNMPATCPGHGAPAAETTDTGAYPEATEPTDTAPTDTPTGEDGGIVLGTG